MEEFVTFEIAKKLKEKGFRDKCYKHYYPDSPDWFLSSYLECNNYSDYVDAPTISQVLKWLREEKKYHICIGYDGVYSYEIVGIEDCEFVAAEDSYDTYEEAALAGIEYILNNVI